MFRRLILMRHAKSDWGTQAATDHERPLNARGRRDAVTIAERLVQLKWFPEYVLSSDAQRTRETWQLMEAQLTTEASRAPVVDFRRELYLADRDELAPQFAAFGDEVGCVLALGHNPGWEEAASWLSGQSLHMPTACAVLLQCSAEPWRAAIGTRGGWHVEHVLRPKDLA